MFGASQMQICGPRLSDNLFFVMFFLPLFFSATWGEGGLRDPLSPIQLMIPGGRCLGQKPLCFSVA